jgi:hypothetical protein
MLSIKRAAGLGASVAVLAAVGPVTGAGAATVPVPLPTPAQPITLASPGDVYQPDANATLAAWQSQAGVALAGFSSGSDMEYSAWQAALAKLPAGAALPAPSFPMPPGM